MEGLGLYRSSRQPAADSSQKSEVGGQKSDIFVFLNSIFEIRNLTLCSMPFSNGQLTTDN
jgi:hypothetical protein